MRRIGVLFGLRLLMVSEAVVGGLSLAYVERPAVVIGAALCWIFAGCLLGLVPHTDPYRPPRRSPKPKA